MPALVRIITYTGHPVLKMPEKVGEHQSSALCTQKHGILARAASMNSADVESRVSLTGGGKSNDLEIKREVR